MGKHPVLKRIKKHEETLISIRRHLHRHPELSNQEENTAAYVAEMLHNLDLKVQTHISPGHGVTGLLDVGAKRTVAIRSDMDALPILEARESSYRSQNEGVMHACGHDCHMTIALGAALVFTEMRDQLAANIKFIFQPAEELPPGGARFMIEEGVLQNPPVEAVFGYHMDPFIPVGQIGIKDGALMANADYFYITIYAEGGHAAYPHRGQDGVLIGSMVVQALQNITSREIEATRPAVVSIGEFKAGDAPNVLAHKVEMSGTARSFDDEVRVQIPQRIDNILKHLTSMMGASYEFQYHEGYPAVDLNPQINQYVRSAVRDVLGEDALLELTVPKMGGEDLGYFLREVPGTMLRVGVYNPDKDCIYPLHHPRFDVDENSLLYGTATLIQSILNYVHDRR
ncbi:MAG: amidohydrolase [Gemmatimonadetes bacterium]|nr:MAG: amidohydrolase [Gemmatimonadota bacterium]